MRHKLVDGVSVALSAQEEAARDAEEAAWTPPGPDQNKIDAAAAKTLPSVVDLVSKTPAQAAAAAHACNSVPELRVIVGGLAAAVAVLAKRL